MPPPMRFQTIGLKEEIVELYPEFKLRLRAAIDRCKETNEMNLQLMGLREVPREVLKVAGIQQLRLDQNQHLEFPQGIPSELRSLKLLSVRNCCFTELPDNISILAKLETLDLQENKLNEIPLTVSRLKRLARLDLSKNRIYRMRPGLGALERLEYVNIDGNCISDLPVDLSSCKSLKTLNCARNRLRVLPLEYCSMLSIRRLNIENNRLLAVPPAIKEMRLEVLRMGYNLIEGLPSDMFSGELGRYIKKFSVQENNLLEFPMSMKEIVNDIILEAEFNPLFSPPSQVLSEGFRVCPCMQYTRRFVMVLTLVICRSSKPTCECVLLDLRSWRSCLPEKTSSSSPSQPHPRPVRCWKTALAFLLLQTRTSSILLWTSTLTVCIFQWRAECSCSCCCYDEHECESV
jgi:hypothetical protein